MQIAKVILVIVVLIALAIPVYFFILGYYSKTGKAPGLVSGQLSPCPDKPNCVNSEFSDDTTHFVDAMTYPDTAADDIRQLLQNTIQAQNGVVVAAENNYIAATFTSRIFGFIDDLEIRVDPEQQLLHIRSASRVGHSDLGANKNRVELLRSQLQQVL